MSDLFSHSYKPNPEDSNKSLGDHSLFAEVVRVVYASDDGGYCVVKVHNQDLGEVTIVGPAMSSLTPGEEIDATGKWIKHKDYGRQFKVENLSVQLPASNDGMVRFLADNLPGIGKKTAENIVKHFGSNTFDILDNYTARLKEVPGLGKKRIEEISEIWQVENKERSIRVFLQGLSISNRQCGLIIEKYGSSAPAIIKDNPYTLAKEIRGIGFIQADKIAQSIGIALDNPFRLASGLVYCVDQQGLDGHTCIPRDYLLHKACELMQLELEAANTGLERALADGAITSVAYCGQEFIYSRIILENEELLSEHICLTTKLDREQTLKKVNLDFINHDLNQEQQEAVSHAFNFRLSIITGGPGVGKTTTVKEIVAQARRANKKIKLAAPTGRAAQRLGEAGSMRATTIHRLLLTDSENEGEFVYGEDKKLNCDMLVVDEVSMLDVSLAAKLFSAIEHHSTQVILVGDPDQLPSVGPGLVLNDMLASETLPITRLVQIFRQAAASRIITNAHRINAGQDPELRNPPEGQLSDFYFIRQENPEKIFEVVTKMIKERIPQRFGIASKDIQVLTPMNRGACGTEALNKHLQAALNNMHKPQFKFGESRFVLGDRVIQTVNNYDKQVFNGDLGYITDVQSSKKSFTITFDSGPTIYEYEEATQIKLAYAITIHKSQGSEFPAVIVPMTMQHFVMLRKNLLYTAVTRAKNLLVLCASPKAIGMAVRNVGKNKRFTLLRPRLRNELKGSQLELFE